MSDSRERFEIEECDKHSSKVETSKVEIKHDARILLVEEDQKSDKVEESDPYTIPVKKSSGVIRNNRRLEERKISCSPHVSRGKTLLTQSNPENYSRSYPVFFPTQPSRLSNSYSEGFSKSPSSSSAGNDDSSAHSQVTIHPCPSVGSAIDAFSTLKVTLLSPVVERMEVGNESEDDSSPSVLKW